MEDPTPRFPEEQKHNFKGGGAVVSAFDNHNDLQQVPEAYSAEYEQYLENEEVPTSAIPPKQQEVPTKLKQEASLGNL